MKMRLFFALSILFLVAFKPSAPETFKVDTKNSSIAWVAGKVGGSHEGIIKLSSGNLVFEGNNLKSGAFAIDMASMTITDLKGTANRSLMNHLKGEDFFAVTKHPTSTFELTNVSATGTNRVNVSGNLTIKGITHPITFPATIKKQKNAVAAVAKGIKVDRTKYDIKYRSKSFFGDIGDKAIDDEFEIAINLVAKK
jgi:polyisoprenoid-binding protein YceI